MLGVFWSESRVILTRHGEERRWDHWHSVELGTTTTTPNITTTGLESTTTGGGVLLLENFFHVV